ncbi:carbohydrate kinase family protein [Falsigemmobacter faecalis]|uniref:Carbohydrate kinase n=1 Tax=Falsigemmobacter faecalis TaxID=2488730 RepID=A0A3P3DRL9_9RHOB|nr:carbohydrate kinase [Falsigemmobacter faecalis]RRH76887.1 carbohydrate kinase [Falsigemmobacter faecalis]
MILCCGEVLIDLVPRPGDHEGALLPLPGGGPFNTAIALARLGLETAFFCPVSTDGFGAKIAARLVAEGVQSQGPRTPAPTPLAVVTLDPEGRADYAFHIEATALHAFTPDAPQVDALAQGPADIAVFGGISLGLEPCGTGFEALFRRQKAAGAVIVIDPNIRPAVIAPGDIPRARLARMIPQADILKLSEEDLAWLSAEPEAQLRHWLCAGVSLICLTLGAGGVRILTPQQDFHLPALPVTPVDTIGAGDSFTAGLLSLLWDAGLRSPEALRDLSEDRLRAAADFAQRVAARTCSRAGADPPQRHEVD